MSDQFDLIVLGGGSGGLAAAQRAAEYGASAAVIEHARLGGTCVNVGCVPKKVMYNTAGFAHALHDARGYGFNLDDFSHDWSQIKTKRDAYVLRLNGIYERNLDNKGIRYLAGKASLEGPNTVRVGQEVLSAERIIIATGGSPLVPDVRGAELGITSDGFFELEDRPQQQMYDRADVQRYLAHCRRKALVGNKPTISSCAPCA